MKLLEDTLGVEGYHLVIEPDGILLMANSTAGTFNGLQTLKQLFPVKRAVSDDGEILPVKDSILYHSGCSKIRMAWFDAGCKSSFLYGR